MSTDGTCPVCELDVETLFHRFRDCPSSVAIWSGFKIRNQNQFFSDSNWNNWLKKNLNQQEFKGEETYWGTLFGVALDTIWSSRNELVFSQKRSSANGLRCRIKNQTEWIVACILKKDNLQPQLLLQHKSIATTWHPPPRGRWKINCDGSVRDNGRTAGCGGILRGSNGEFIFAFSRRLHPCTIVEAELQGILHNLRFAWTRGFKSLMVETDSKEAIELINHGRSDVAGLQQLLNEILEVGQSDIDVNWSLVGREINRVVDQMAKNSHTIVENSVVYNYVPGFIANLLLCNDVGPSGQV